jgi:SAM-dependent methyltransferase
VPYSPADYWGELHRRDDLSSVGQSALPAGINRWLYVTLARNVRGHVKRHGLHRPQPRRVLDVGAGTGFWVEFWRQLGAHVDGVDLVPVAVERLRERFGESSGGGRFWVADIAQPGSLGGDPYDVVSVMNVLLHVTADEPFEAALRNIAARVAPGGWLLMVEPILVRTESVRPYDPDKHSRARPLALYRDPLEAAGLELVEICAATVLANNPIEAGSPEAEARYRRWWTFVAGRSKRDPASSRWLGPLVSGLDRLALLSRAAPSSKLVLFRRPA